jgi:hypothetical protein
MTQRQIHHPSLDFVLSHIRLVYPNDFIEHLSDSVKEPELADTVYCRGRLSSMSSRISCFAIYGSGTCQRHRSALRSWLMNRIPIERC